MTMKDGSFSDSLRDAVRLVAILNLAYFAVEFAVAYTIGSVSLFADSLSFLEYAFVNYLILIGLRRNAHFCARLGRVLDGILLVPGLATLWTAGQKLLMPIPPAPIPLLLAGAGALAVNLSCSILLMRYRKHPGSRAKAVFLPIRKDVLAKLAIVGAGLLTVYNTQFAWPDLFVGGGIALMNARAIKKVFEKAQDEQSQHSSF